MGMRIAVVGVGGLGSRFVPVFQAHPSVDEVVLADVMVDRLAEQAARFGVGRTYDSLEAVLASDVDAVAIFTQRHLHGQQTLDALSAGKHVYCAVPIGNTEEEIRAIVAAVEETRLVYMSGETSYYYPSTIYCRSRFRSGDFGHLFYAEGQYYHDMARGFYEAYQRSGGADWKRFAGFPPMLYPTHSVGMVLAVTDSYVTSVSSLGYEDRHEDGIFRRGANHWDNPFSNQSALMRTADGGMIRINEFRRVGWHGFASVQMNLFYRCHLSGAGGRARMGDPRWGRGPHGVAGPQGSGRRLGPPGWGGVARPGHPVVARPPRRAPPADLRRPRERASRIPPLPRRRLRAGRRHRLPPAHPRVGGCRYCLPGLVAHESSLRDGEVLTVADLGGPPDDWARLDPDRPTT